MRLLNKNLTTTQGGFMMPPLSQKTKVGVRSPEKTGHTRPLSHVVFLCPPKTPAALRRLFSVMVGCIEQPLKRLAGACTGTSNLMHPATQCFEALIGGYSLYTGVTA